MKKTELQPFKASAWEHKFRIGEKKMDWPVRLTVAIGAARGLTYLHTSFVVGFPVVHRDFKSTNIIVNDDYEAKKTVSNSNVHVQDNGLDALIAYLKAAYADAEGYHFVSVLDFD
ncbi:hypothetical protein L6452_29503 [Arctium lappa]|uniref:Uncharacterized protein n=1 Tax=Arctium lappa TaxID=4217 RepID=A0ACB8ZH00_ARCLA|nr:hypothetical protein L6452_29503 [Arctium lappa]